VKKLSTEFGVDSTSKPSIYAVLQAVLRDKLSV
jgi:hypothetical protein